MQTNQAMITGPRKNDAETGLLICNSYNALSGFIYLAGFREVGELKIIEGVARGSACNFLVSLMVYDGKGNLLFDAKLDKQTNYSRELVKSKVLEGMIQMIQEACVKDGRTFNKLGALQKLNAMLNSAYYAKSYEAVMQWAESIGII